VTDPAAALLVDRADAARDRRDWPAAAELYAAALAIDDRRADLWVQYGHALKEGGDLARALEAYETALAQDPDVADTHLQLGHALKMSGDRQAAGAAYARAAMLDPAGIDPVTELRDLVRHGLILDPEVADTILIRSRSRRRAPPPTDILTEGLRAALLRLGTGGNPTLIAKATAGLKAVEALVHDAARRRTTRPSLVFDTSDLIAYFRAARLPTGIQRVQIETIAALLRDTPADTRLSVCAFVEDRDEWVAIPAGLFLDLARHALAGGALDDAAWLAIRRDLDLETGLGPVFAFPDGAWLINLGTSWWLQNYFLKLRKIRRLQGVRYVPFVHDMIPVLAPEHCTPALTRDFISWAAGVVGHAGHFLTNSEASRRDLLAVADRLGQAIDPANVHVVRLNADFRKPGSPESDCAILTRLGLGSEEFVLFVSTVESRKNHVDAFRAWRTLIDRHGAGAVPYLVCVGARGWLNDAVFALLDQDPILKSRIIMASSVSDPELADLYRSCAFTLYPSLYEGWGLPVTEALCHGKAVLASDASSLPEAGGEFASYFRSGDRDDLVVQLERMMFEPGFRQSQMERIIREFRPRAWRELGQEMIDCVVGWSERPGNAGPAPALPAPSVTRGRAYSLGRVTATRIDASLMSGETFRSGDGWAAPETWGCSTTGDGGTLTCRMPEPVGDLRLVLGLRGPPLRDAAYAITVGPTQVADGRLTAGEVVWLEMRIPAACYIDDTVAIRIGETGAPDTSQPPGTGRRLSNGVVGFMLDAADTGRPVAAIIADFETALSATD